MSLLVLDPDTEGTESLCQQLSGLGFNSLSTTASQDAVQLCNSGTIEVVLCGALELIPDLESLPVGTGIVYFSRHPLVLDAVLLCIRSGVHDCWQLPLTDAEMYGRLNQVTARIEHWLQQADIELHAIRSELERDQRAGQYIQLGMLPPNPMGIGHFRLQHRVEPSLILSGDFVDYFQITDGHFACYVADVAGHGASSAFVTVLLKNFSRRLRREYRVSMLTNPGEFLAWINNELIDQQIEKHVAMFFAVVDVQNNVLHYSNAAHFPPALLVGAEGVTSLEQKGKPLGLFPSAQFESQQVSFPRGARVVVFSDGILDLIDAPSLADKEQALVRAAQECEDMDALWARFDISKLGQDDVSCLMINNG
jgi:phosphoserine phosphatase RsbU/P